MTQLTGTLGIQPALTYTGDTDVGNAPIKTVTDALGLLTVDDLDADLFVADTRTLASGATETLDLTAIGEALAGKPVTFGKVFALVIVGNDANTTALTIGAAGSNPFDGPLGGTSPTFDIKPGVGAALAFMSATGWTVDSTHKSLLVTNAVGAAATYTIVIIGSVA